jgi:hypothetical protein
MTSARKIAANQRNGKKSRGPRTAAGKVTASRNALRHGLAANVHRVPTFAGEIESIAKALVGDSPNSLLLERALAVAAPEFMLQFIAKQRIAVIERHLNKSADQSKDEQSQCRALEEAMPDLERLARYERRTRSQWKRAVASFIESKDCQ